jgi:hypothetical protein
MSKRNSDGDVLINRLSLGLAKSQRILASMLGPAPESHAISTTTPEPNEDEDDFNKEFAEPEQCVDQPYDACNFTYLPMCVGLALAA